MPLMPGAEPWSADGDHVGVLVLHGFTGSPASMRPWAEDLAGRGLDRAGARGCPATAPRGRT